MNEMAKRGRKTWADVLKDPRVDEAYVDDDGAWVELKQGFADLLHDPKQPTHIIHGWKFNDQDEVDEQKSKADAIYRLFHAVGVCACKYCTWETTHQIESTIQTLLEETTSWSVNNDIALPAGVSLQGKIKVSFNKLVEIFGDPKKAGPLAQDQRAYWKIFWDDSISAMIYDYNQSADIQDVKVWNIGSKDKIAVERIEEILEL